MNKTHKNVRLKTIWSNCFLIFLITIFWGLIGVTAQTKAVLNADEQNLTALIKQAVDAQADFDAAALDRIYACDYVEISPVGEVDLRDKAIGFYKPQVNKSGSHVKTTAVADEFSVRIYEKFAVVISRVTFSQLGNETPSRPPMSFRATYVCRKEKGKWKISSVQVTGIRPSRPPQTK